MKHTSRVCRIVREHMDATRNKGEYPEGLDYKVYIVACGYILGNEKYWISTDLPDGKYFEVTYNAERDEFYLDGYVRIYNAERDEFYLDGYVRIYNEAIGGGTDG